MVVSFTPNIGLAKPDATEIAEKWINFDKLQEDNNLQLIDKMDVNLQTWTPALIAATVNPNVGAGTRQGEYIDVQGIIMASFTIEFTDPGVAAGTGEFGISLPEEVDNSFHSVGTALTAAPGQYSCIGNGYIYDSSAVATSGAVALDVVTIASVSYVRFVTEVFTAPAKTSRFQTNAQPMTPATGDVLNGFVIYKKAP